MLLVPRCVGKFHPQGARHRRRSSEPIQPSLPLFNPAWPQKVFRLSHATKGTSPVQLSCSKWPRLTPSPLFLTSTM